MTRAFASDLSLHLVLQHSAKLVSTRDCRDASLNNTTSSASAPASFNPRHRNFAPHTAHTTLGSKDEITRDICPPLHPPPTRRLGLPAWSARHRHEHIQLHQRQISERGGRAGSARGRKEDNICKTKIANGSRLQRAGTFQPLGVLEVRYINFISRPTRRCCYQTLYDCPSQPRLDASRS